MNRNLIRKIIRGIRTSFAQFNDLIPTNTISQTRSLPRKREHILLGLLIAIISIINLIWTKQNQARMMKEDCYIFLRNLIGFVDQVDLSIFTHFWSSLSSLSDGGRPPLYQLLTTPFIFLLGRSEDAALSVNILFLCILMISTYNMARLVKNGVAGLLAACLVASYPPVVQLSRGYMPHFAVPACVALSMWLILLLLNDRSIKIAWLFGASLAFGLLIHPNFVFFLFVPTVIFGLYMLLFQTRPRFPVGFKNIHKWMFNKFRDRFVTLGLLPGALIALGLALPWYLTKSLDLLGILQTISAPELAEFRGVTTRGVGFPDVKPDFWWYAQTAPGAISNILAVFVMIGLVFTVIRGRLPSWVLGITLISSYIVRSLLPSYAWMYFVAVLPVAAGLTAVWIIGVRPKWLATVLTIVCLAVAAFNFSVVTWGIQPWSQIFATALGAPLSDNLTCNVPYSCALCPAPAQPDLWPVRLVQQKILEDPECRAGRPCRLMSIHTREGIWIARMSYLLVRDHLQRRLVVTGQGIRELGHVFNLRGLLKADYLLYTDRKYRRIQDHYVAASVRFLQSPPPAFAEAHETVASFEYTTGFTAKLVKRIKPLTVMEAESSIEALELSDPYKAQQPAIMAELYASEGDLQKAMVQYGKISDEQERASIRRVLLEKSRTLKEQTNQAIALYQDTLKANPGNIDARLHLAREYVHIGETERAIAEFETAIDLAPHNAAPPRLMLADLYRSLEQIDRVIAIYQELLEVDPNNLAIRLRLAKDYADGGQTEKAIGELEAAISLAPDKPAPRRRLAQLYSTVGQNEQAAFLYQEAKRIDPGNLDTRLRLALAYGKIGKAAEGVAELKEAIAQWPTNIIPRLMLAGTYRKMGKTEEASDLYQQALQINPDSIQARKELALIKE